MLSQSVAKGLKLLNNEEYEGTINFVDYFDKWFDCMNVSAITVGKLTRNLFKCPYRSANDFRLEVIVLNLVMNIQSCFVSIVAEETFLLFLQKWKETVENRTGFSDSTKKMMLLSAETRAGLEITGYPLISCPCSLSSVIITVIILDFNLPFSS